MKKHTLSLIPVCIILLLSTYCSQSEPTITDKEVIVQAGKMDVHFSRGKSFKKNIMLFGGDELRQSGAFFNAHLAGLNVQTARSIYTRYPDFQKCKSPGAPLAQRAIENFEIVYADSKIQKQLKKALSAYKKSVDDSDNMGVCVKFEGELIRLKKVIVRELDKDITSELPPQMKHDYYLVQAVEVTPSEEALQKK